MALSEHDRLRRAELATILHMCHPEVPIARVAAMIDRFYDLELAFIEMFDFPRYMIGARRGLDMAIMHKWGDRPIPPIAPVLAEDLPAQRGTHKPIAIAAVVEVTSDMPAMLPRFAAKHPQRGDRAPCEICGLPSTYNGAAWVHDPPAPTQGAISQCEICGARIYFAGVVWWHASGAPRDAHMPAPVRGIGGIYYEKGLWWEE